MRVRFKIDALQLSTAQEKLIEDFAEACENFVKISDGARVSKDTSSVVALAQKDTDPFAAKNIANQIASIRIGAECLQGIIREIATQKLAIYYHSYNYWQHEYRKSGDQVLGVAYDITPVLGFRTADK